MSHKRHQSVTLFCYARTCNPHQLQIGFRMTNPNPLHLANTAQNMARNAPKDDAMVFNKVAMICMGVMAGSSILQTIQPLLKSFAKRESDRDSRHGRER